MASGELDALDLLETSELTVGLLGLGLASSALGDVYIFDGPDGLSGEVEFALADGGSTLVLRVKNKSTGVPNGFDNADQILTGDDINETGCFRRTQNLKHVLSRGHGRDVDLLAMADPIFGRKMAEEVERMSLGSTAIMLHTT